ncbi:MAG TPA: murein biosynthesis integral membrane protein MurJ [Chloroflexota bacterium]|nr:murein biosynthesis integral membrane protein MurJ [Chloroflexota bacterium]
MLQTERRRRLAGSAIIMMAAYVASRLTGLLRDIAISYRFGTGRELDAYLAAVRVPDIVFQVVAGAAVASAFIPVYTSYLTRREEEEGANMLNILFTISFLVLVPMIALAFIFAPRIMPIIVPDFPPEYQALAARLARVVLLAPLFFTLGCFTTSVLNAHGKFFLAALAPTSYNLGIIFGAVVFSRWLGIYGLAAGALLGSAFYLVVQLPGLRQIGFVFQPHLDLSHRGVRAVGRLMGPRAIGLAVTQANFIVALYLASGIPGGVAALNYAWLLTMLPLGIFAMAISTAVFPSLAEHGAVHNHEELQRTLLEALRFILFLTIPASLGLIVLSFPIVRLVFQRGEFTSVSTTMTADALHFYAAGLLGMATVEIITRAFYALHDTFTPVKVATLGMAVNLTLGILLVRTMGESGLALATAVASTGEAVLLFAICRQRVEGVSFRALVAAAWRSIVAALVMGACLGLFSVLGQPLSRSLAGAPFVVAAIALGGVVYLLTTVILGAQEVGQLQRLASRLAGRIPRFAG